MIELALSKIWRERKYVLACMSIAAVLGVMLVFLIPARYVSTSRIIPPQQVQSSLGAIVGQMGAIGFAGLGSLRFPSDVYVQLLRSDTVARAVVERFALAEHYNLEKFEDIRKRLANRSYIRGIREGIVVIRITDRNAEMAATLANGYVEELYKAIQRLALEEATHRRQFMESKLLEIKKSLAAKEADFRAMQETIGMVRVDGQVENTFTNMGGLRAAITMKEVQLRAMAYSATEQDPVYRNVVAEISALKIELRKLEESPAAKNPKFVVAADRAPGLLLAYIRKLRDLRFEEAMYTALQKQYELIRMEETRDFQQFLVIDAARPATKAEFPTAPMIVFLSVLAGLALALYLVVGDRIWYPAKLWKKDGAATSS